MTAAERAARKAWLRALDEALAAGRCNLTSAGWCTTHSTSAGPVYCAVDGAA